MEDERFRKCVISGGSVIDDKLEFLYETVWLEGHILIQKKMFFFTKSYKWTFYGGEQLKYNLY